MPNSKQAHTASAVPAKRSSAVAPTVPPISSDTLTYVHELPPDAGATIEIGPRLLWLRLPLPFVLNHVNCWLADDGDRWSIIDTGADRPDTRDYWEAALAGPMGGKPVDRLICTHGHPDHIGLAGWLCEKLDARLHMTLAEWLAPQLWREQGLQPMRADEKRAFRRSGVSDKALEKMMQAREAAPFRNHPLPMSLARMRDGETITFAGRDWTVLVNGGHAEEHASFYCARDKILIAGDQILSKISPVVGVYTSQPWGNPLKDYLASLKRLATLPDDTLVLPSHGLPFYGLHARCRQLDEHHHKRLGQLLALMDGRLDAGKTGVELAKGLFEAAVAKGQLMMALAETLAHVNYLVEDGRVRRIEDGDVYRFVRT
jgi:glyoxylase-like metal-dependent hydrolase (beta-lactamase superfamily II)